MNARDRRAEEARVDEFRRALTLVSRMAFEPLSRPFWDDSFAEIVEILNNWKVTYVSKD